MRQTSICILSVTFLTVIASGQSSGPARPPSSTATPSNSGSKSGMLDGMSKKNLTEGRLVPRPGRALTLELLRQGQQVTAAMSEADGTFRFFGASTGVAYQLRILLKEDTEYRGPISFQSGAASNVLLTNPRYIFTIHTGQNKQFAGNTVSLANLLAPQKAVDEFEKGRELAGKKQFEEGLSRLKKAVEIYPPYPDAHNETGIIQREVGHLPEAEEAFSKAVEADPRWTDPYLNLAQLQLNRKDFESMFKTTARTLQLDPTLGAAHFFQAMAYLSSEKLEDAEREALLAEKDQRSQIPQVQMILGNIYEVRGNSVEAVRRYRLFLTQVPESSTAARVTAHIAELERPGKAP